MKLRHFETKTITVGSFAYAPGFNPYQRLFTNALEEAGVNVLRIPPAKWWPLTKACRRPVDILHLDWHYDWYRGKNWLTRELKRVMYHHGLAQFRRLPVVWTAHNLAAHDVDLGRSSAANDDHRMTQALIKRCQGIMVMSGASERLLRERYTLPKSIRVAKVPHGHYIDAYPNVVSHSQSRKKLGLTDAANVFLSLGSLRPYKGHRELIAAFGQIATADDHLLIAGKSLDSSYLDSLTGWIASQPTSVRDRIELHVGEIADESLQDYFAAADIAVLPFSDILNSGSLLLALSFGLPVVAPSIGSIPEVAIKEYHQGYSPQDSGGLQRALTNARLRFGNCGQIREERIDRRRARSQAIIDETRKRYSWKSSAAKLVEFYQELLAQNSTTRHASDIRQRNEF
ncbi:hypothetical protein CKO51_12060 [Rhodopirellula sp. SM50]|nr:glycosyltransferase family 4 protein [Rhodopirellula sp. SM50]PAY19339.1 hypothetical protein CKO51_12060 [Rhodopirellula sp. SM50]